MPALVNSRLGSLPGTSGALGTIVCPRSRKKSRNDCRIWSPVTGEGLSAASGGGNPDTRSGLVRRRRPFLHGPVAGGQTKSLNRGGVVQAIVERPEEVVAFVGSHGQRSRQLDGVVSAKPMLAGEPSRSEREGFA